MKFTDGAKAFAVEGENFPVVREKRLYARGKDNEGLFVFFNTKIS